MPCKLKKDVFLANRRNKQMLINLLAVKLVEHGCIVRHASRDADRLIVMTAIEFLGASDVIVVDKDTDLLVHLYFSVILLNPTPNDYSLCLIGRRTANYGTSNKLNRHLDIKHPARYTFSHRM